MVKFRSSTADLSEDIPTDEKVIETLNKTILNLEDENSGDENEPNMSTTTDTANFVLRVFNTVYNGDPLLLNTINDQLNLISVSVKTADIPIAISAIKSRLAGKARAAITNEDTIAKIQAQLKTTCSGEPSWNISTTLSGIRFTDKDKFAESLLDVSQKLKDTLRSK